MVSTQDNQQRLDWALQIAQEAGEITLQHFRQPSLAVERKGDDSPVTVADKAAETLLRERIGQKFPEDAIVGEEFGESSGSSGFTWCLDPIDGTKSFIHGIPLYTTLIGILHGPSHDRSQNSTEVGVIRAPALDEVIYARRGGGAWHQRGSSQPKEASVGATSDLSVALLLTTEVGTFRERDSGQGIEAYLELDQHVRLARTWGDAYGYLMVATGRADVMIDPEMNLWDAAALQPVIEEAGGTFCDWHGQPTVHSREAVRPTPSLCRKCLSTSKASSF